LAGAEQGHFQRQKSIGGDSGQNDFRHTKLSNTELKNKDNKRLLNNSFGRTLDGVF
jgi:hypothetical protein